ncbi:hypothetical protein FIBSPDRAFT_1050949 [Athelia psychrophila]|uniref:Uncharacterized protein n=1 Tax=Athelia psychrophila TaxID=1759441 RepID=A0A166A0T5_9AGAM|nr:hypothetical protein FIBSPDRAFT_1050949 [Fibularhizoctonia sp. CBS 109695]
MSSINGHVHASAHSNYSSLAPSQIALPQRPPHPVASNSRRVMFDFDGANQPGVGMSALNTRAIAGGSEIIAHPIVLWIKWAGYEHIQWDGVRVSPGNMSRADIAKRVAQCFKDFTNHAQAFPIDPNYAQFRAGRGGVTLDKLVLTSLACMVGELWVAEVMVERA